MCIAINQLKSLKHPNKRTFSVIFKSVKMLGRNVGGNWEYADISYNRVFKAYIL